jgi:hypothetical protein
MNRPSARLVVVGMTLCVLGGSAAVASADTDGTQGKKNHMICLIDQDGPSGPQHGLCLVIPLGSQTGH